MCVSADSQTLVIQTPDDNQTPVDNQTPADNQNLVKANFDMNKLAQENELTKLRVEMDEMNQTIKDKSKEISELKRSFKDLQAKLAVMEKQCGSKEMLAQIAMMEKQQERKFSNQFKILETERSRLEIEIERKQDREKTLAQQIATEEENLMLSDMSDLSNVKEPKTSDHKKC